MNELSLFAGSGGGILGGYLLGWRTRCAVEVDPYARSSLLSRQRDGFLPRFPIWDDVRTFDGRPWRGSIDVVSGGFPCQDISVAGPGEGITGERSGLWSHQARIIREVQPEFALVENSPALTYRGLGVVLGDLAAMGYNARWGVLGAADAIWDHCDPCGDHLRQRIWIVGTLSNSNRLRELQPERCVKNERRWPGDALQEIPDAMRLGLSGSREHVRSCDSKEDRNRKAGRSLNGGEGGKGWWNTEPNMGRMADGLASPLDIHGAHAAGNVARVGQRIPKRGDRLRCIGNGQVPATLALAWKILSAE